jgi:hypothetical protein
VWDLPTAPAKNGNPLLRLESGRGVHRSLEGEGILSWFYLVAQSVGTTIRCFLRLFQ